MKNKSNMWCQSFVKTGYFSSGFYRMKIYTGIYEYAHDPSSAVEVYDFLKVSNCQDSNLNCSIKE